jgi:hypothetical protein
VAAALTDSAWADICAAAGRTPDAEARAELSAILFDEYPAFAYDRARVAKALRRGGRMLKHLGAFALDHRAQFPRADDIKTERDLFYIQRLYWRAEAVWIIARALRRANAGHRNTQREWLYHRLCGVWLDHFGARSLSYSVPSLGGPPYGPLIAFMLAAIRQVVSEEALPSPETVRDAIDRDRRERENAKQLVLRLRKPMGA